MKYFGGALLRKMNTLKSKPKCAINIVSKSLLYFEISDENDWILILIRVNICMTVDRREGGFNYDVRSIESSNYCFKTRWPWVR